MNRALGSKLGCGLVLTLCVACASGKHWVNQAFYENKKDEGIRLYDGRGRASPDGFDKATSRLGSPRSPSSELKEEPASQDEQSGPRPQLSLTGKKARPFVAPPDGRLLGVFRNTYYDFPAESSFAPGTDSAADGSQRVALMTPACQPIVEVPRAFFESICVQGSGTLVSGATVSFAKRDCSCAEVCPRTNQKICFEALDPHEFPWGRGALGKPITPLTSVAVDSAVIELGTHIYIPEYDGVERHAGGGPHDGCFVAEDRGMKVQGKHVDVFSGNPSVTAHLNAVVPSNVGVHVYVETARCR